MLGELQEKADVEAAGAEDTSNVGIDGLAEEGVGGAAEAFVEFEGVGEAVADDYVVEEGEEGRAEGHCGSARHSRAGVDVARAHLGARRAVGGAGAGQVYALKAGKEAGGGGMGEVEGDDTAFHLIDDIDPDFDGITRGGGDYDVGRTEGAGEHARMEG